MDDENSQAKRLKDVKKIYENCKNLNQIAKKLQKLKLNCKNLDQDLTNKTDQTEKSTEKLTEEQSKYMEKNS